MTPTEFKDTVREMLTEPWGEKSYPPPVTDRLWRMVRTVNVGEFRAALDTLMMTSVRAPNLGQIRGACIPAINRAIEEARREKISSLGAHTCQHCAGTGWVVTIPFDNPLGDRAFICTKCESAKIRGIRPGRGAEYWRDEFAHGHFIRRATTESVREYAADMMEKHYDDVRGLQRKKKPKRVLPSASGQEWAQQLLQDLREGEGVGAVLRNSLDLSGPDSDA